MHLCAPTPHSFLWFLLKVILTWRVTLISQPIILMTYFCFWSMSWVKATFEKLYRWGLVVRTVTVFHVLSTEMVYSTNFLSTKTDFFPLNFSPAIEELYPNHLVNIVHLSQPRTLLNRSSTAIVVCRYFQGFSFVESYSVFSLSSMHIRILRIINSTRISLNVTFSWTQTVHAYQQLICLLDFS